MARLLALVFVSAFSVVTLGMPLGATKLYLFGISVDQQFRTEYLTRLTDSSALHDMTYVGLPPFYPPGWFWVGGRLAALTGTPGWETFKPWAITSITIAIAMALVLWWRMIRFEYAVIVTAAPEWAGAKEPTLVAIGPMRLTPGSRTVLAGALAVLLGIVAVLALGLLFTARRLASVERTLRERRA